MNRIIQPPMRMLQSAWNKITATVGRKPAETGGLLFGSRKDMIIRLFVPDPRTGTVGTYTINSKYFNPRIEKLYKKGLVLLGILHSHPRGFLHPSIQDVSIGKKYLERFELGLLYFPIVLSKADHKEYAVLPFAFSATEPGNKLVKLPTVEIIPDAWAPPLPVREVPQIAGQVEEKEEAQHQQTTPVSPSVDYSRVEQAVSIPTMQASHIVVVGTGGAASFCKQIARLGIGRLTLIDADVCGTENIPRQSFYLTDAVMAKPKVEALKEDIQKINPAVTVEAVQADFMQLDQQVLDNIIKSADVLLFLTDNFDCQAYGNKVALAHNKPAIWAGYYKLSRAAELFFYIPGITNGCFRCAVSSRYEAQAKKRVKISSAANTIFHSELLDSYIGIITLAILHNNIAGYEFSDWFPKGFNHNFIQFKVSPKYEGIFKELHGDNNNSFFNFGALWQEVVQETIANGFAYDCPDCACREHETTNI